jgi:general secretion pathway protein G
MKNSRGFTLIELIVAVTIIALLMAAAVVSYTSTALKSRDAKRASDMEVIRSALEICRSQDGQYPGAGIDNSVICPVSGLVTLKKTPVDPRTGEGGYTYDYSRPTTTTYTLSCLMEDNANCKGTLSGGRCEYTEP